MGRFVVTAPEPTSTRLHQHNESPWLGDPGEFVDDALRDRVQPVAQGSHAKHGVETGVGMRELLQIGNGGQVSGRAASSIVEHRTFEVIEHGRCHLRKPAASRPAAARRVEIERRCRDRCQVLGDDLGEQRPCCLKPPVVLPCRQQSFVFGLFHLVTVSLVGCRGSYAHRAGRVRALQCASVGVQPVTAGSFTGSTCVVTGGCGFVGSNLVHRLHQAGAVVRVIDALVDGHGGDRRNLEGLDVPILVADIGEPVVADAIRDAGFVFNVAGQVSHTESMRNPLRDLALNAVSHASFLETVRSVNPDVRIVQTSTRQVYGRAGRVPVDETHETQPVDVNGVAKLAGEQLHLVYHKAYGMATTCLRLTNVYGPRQRLTSNELGFLPVFIRKALLGESIEIFGDGLQRRDVLFVDDVVDAILAASADVAIGQVFNVGHSRDHSLVDVARVIVEAAGSSATPRLVAWPVDHKSIDIGSFHTDGRKIVEQLGWNARTDLQQGVEQTIAFYREHPWYLSTT